MPTLFDGDWSALVLRLDAPGVARDLAINAECIGYQPSCNHFSLAVTADAAVYAKPHILNILQRSLSQIFGPSVQISVFLKESAVESGLADQLRAIAQNMSPDTEIRMDAVYTPLEISRGEVIH